MMTYHWDFFFSVAETGFYIREYKAQQIMTRPSFLDELIVYKCCSISPVGELCYQSVILSLNV